MGSEISSEGVAGQPPLPPPSSALGMVEEKSKYDQEALHFLHKSHHFPLVFHSLPLNNNSLLSLLLFYIFLSTLIK